MVRRRSLMVGVLLVGAWLAVGPRSAESAVGDITTVVGQVGNGDGGQATAAGFGGLGSVALHPATGDLYISDTAAQRIRKINASTKVISTVVGLGSPGFGGDNGPAVDALLHDPLGIAFDPTGNFLYIADAGNHRIRRVNLATNIITTVAGTGVQGSSGDGNLATDARLASPNDVEVSPVTGEIIVADTFNQVIRKFSVGANIDKIAGTYGSATFAGDGASANSASLNYPRGVDIDAGGVIYVADSSNNRIRKFSDGNNIQTIAGGGANASEGVNPLTASLLSPMDIDLDAAGNVYVALLNGSKIRRVNNTYSSITTVAGDGSNDDLTPPENVLATSVFLQPWDVAVKSDGSKFFIADLYFSQIREVSGGNITTTVGLGALGPSGEGLIGVNSRINSPWAVALDATGAVYFTDTGNRRIRKLANGVVTTVAGTGAVGLTDGDALTLAQFQTPHALAVDAAGTVYVTDAGTSTIRKISGGTVSIFAGDHTAGFADGSLLSARFNAPRGVAIDKTGRMFVADTNNQRIRMISNGIVSTVAGDGTSGVGGESMPATMSPLGDPQALAIDSVGNIYFSESANNRIRRFTVGGNITTVTGSGILDQPVGLAIDANDDVFIADVFNQVIRKYTVSTGILSTVVGTASEGYGGDGGPATSAMLNRAMGVAIDRYGNAYVADTFNHRIRRVESLGAPVPTTTTAASTTPTTTPLVVPRTGGLLPKAIATHFGVTMPKGSRVTITVTKASKKTCYVKKTKLLSRKSGTCKFTVSVKPKKGKTVKLVRSLPSE